MFIGRLPLVGAFLMGLVSASTVHAEHNVRLNAGGMRIDVTGQRSASIGNLGEGAAIYVDGVELRLANRRLSYAEEGWDLPDGWDLYIRSTATGIVIDVGTEQVGRIGEATVLSLAGADLPADKLNDLGVQFLTGQGGVEKDPAKAIEYYGRAAEKGHPLAQSNLAFIYWEGEHVERDQARALDYARQAAEQGNAPAMWMLGYAYANGEGVAQDEVKAREWYKKGGDAGDADSLNNLGNLYASGRGGPAEPEVAVDLFRAAADKGSIVALSNLGEYYRDGAAGLDRDPDIALRYFEAAAKAGDERGLALYNELSTELDKAPFMTDGRLERGKYWFRENDQNVGPLTLSAMEIAVKQFRVRRDDQVWTAATKWQAASNYPELSWLF